MSLEGIVRNQCDSLWGDRVFILSAERLMVAEIDCGALFVYAAWSGDSHVSFKCLCEAILTRPDIRFPVFVVDVDDPGAEALLESFGRISQGKGETFWITKGKVKYVDVGYGRHSGKLLRSRIEAIVA